MQPYKTMNILKVHLEMFLEMTYSAIFFMNWKLAKMKMLQGICIPEIHVQLFEYFTNLIALQV